MTVLDDFDWVEALPEPVCLDVGAQGDEWLHNLRVRLTETTGSTEYQMRDHGPFGHLHMPHQGTLTSSLLVTPSSADQLTCRVLGNGEKRQEEIDLWVEAIEYAVAKLGTTTVFHWRAILGEHPDALVSPSLALVGPRAIGRMELRPPSGPFMEACADELFAWRTERTFPIWVQGSSSGYSASTAIRDAVRDLKVLCSLLSLASGRTWIIRQRPGFASQADSPVVPLPPYSHLYPNGHKMDDNYADPIPFEVPPWVDDAWTKLCQDSKLASLVVTYHEGLLLEIDHHDSFGLLASVAVIEAIGNRRFKGKIPRCDCGKSVIGAQQRFLDALSEVMEGDLAKDMGRRVYGRRSRTAHDGVLHGTELVGGQRWPTALLSDDPPVEFTYLARTLRRAASRLLKLELGGLPGKTKLTRENGSQGIVAMALRTGPIMIS